jgi:aminomethyltransferase
VYRDVEGDRRITGAPLRRSPIHDEHTTRGARMTDSDGWTMPVEFAGVFAEYQACRKSSVVWDASNLGAIRVSGPGAYGLVQSTFTGDLRRAEPGRSLYAFLLSERDASVVDDLMIWWVEPELFVLTPNRTEPVLHALCSARVPDTGIEDVTGDRVLLALQGAQAVDRMAELAPEAARMPVFRCRRVALEAGPAIVATTRFGGRLGYELHLAPECARTVYRTLLGRGVTPAGLGMRETNRVEHGLPRHGYELVPGITPLELGLSQVVGFDTDFVGRAALLDRQRRGVERVLRTVVMAGRRAPEHGSGVFHSGQSVGEVTSGNYSPTRHRGVALAFVRPEVTPGSPVTVRTGRGDEDGEVAR